MRNPERIEEVVNALKDIWKQNPNWRFGQLISNVFGEIMANEHITDMFFPEDDVWLNGLREYRKSHSIYNQGQNLKIGEK